MARNGYGGGNDRNRDGIDDDVDHRPGNSSESAAYSRKYDKRSESEFSNLPEAASQLRYRLQEEELRQQEEYERDYMRALQNHVHFFPSVGKFIIPEENTWAAHAELVKDPDARLAFNPEKYVFFDKIIAEKYKNPALYDPNHPDYAKFEGLRTNLAVMRNDIIGDYLDDGGFDPGDEKFIPLIEGVATEIGKALSHDIWWQRPFTRHVSVDVANVEGVGAREMYKYLLDMQTSAGIWPQAHRAFVFAIGGTQHSWELPALENTPYSDAGLSAPPPSMKLKLTPAELLQHAASPELQAQVASTLEATGEQVATQAHTMLSVVRQLQAPETLPLPAKQQSMEDARTILRWLRNLQFGDRDVETFLNQGTPAEQLAKTEALGKLVDIYGGQLALAQREAPGRLLDLAVMDAGEAAGALSIGVGEHAVSLLPDFHPKIEPIDRLIAALPAAASLRETQSLHQLLDLIELGLERASGKVINPTPPVERLVEMSDKIRAAAYKLRSIDTLEPPARAESVELGREILRKLKNLGFAKQSAQEIVDTGRPDDKATFARKIGEMVGIYQNLLSEAAMANPDIMNDPRIQEANNAVGQFAHTIKLMAAKEIPVSMAASQQISADITQMPEEWKKLDGRTVDRLVSSMEDGLARAVSEIEQQQQAQAQDEELAQQVMDDAMHHSSARGRRRRRRQSAGPSLTKSAKRRNAGDLNGDGVADRFQGMNLNGIDLAAIRELGSSLRTASNEAAALAPPPPPVETNEARPDDRSFAERKTQRDEQSKKAPRSSRNRPQI